MQKLAHLIWLKCLYLQHYIMIGVNMKCITSYSILFDYQLEVAIRWQSQMLGKVAVVWQSMAWQEKLGWQSSSCVTYSHFNSRHYQEGGKVATAIIKCHQDKTIRILYQPHSIFWWINNEKVATKDMWNEPKWNQPPLLRFLTRNRAWQLWK